MFLVEKKNQCLSVSALTIHLMLFHHKIQITYLHKGQYMCNSVALW